jgi:hypothetical protein
MLKSHALLAVFVALLAPTTASSLDAFGLSPIVIGDFAPGLDATTPEAWPVRLWAENFSGFTAEDARATHWAAMFWLRSERFAPGQSLYVQVGSNDPGYLDWESYEASMAFIALRALELGIEKVVIVSSPQRFTWVHDPDLHAMVNDFLEWEADIDAEICAASEDVHCVPVFGLLDNAQHYEPDGMHLSDEGHRVIEEGYVTYVPEPDETTGLVACMSLLWVLGRLRDRGK